MAPHLVELPYELLEELMGYLHPGPGEQKEDLKACSLVSHIWRPIAQVHLFRHMHCTISTSSLEERFDNSLTLQYFPGGVYGMCVSGEGLVRPISRPSRTLDMLVGFLQDHPGLGSHIRTFQLYQGVSFARAEEGRFSATLFSSLLCLIPNVQSLYLRDIALTLPDQFVYPTHRLSLSRLDITHPCPSPSPLDLISLTGYFERIDRLSLRHLDVVSADEDLAVAPAFSPPLVRYLELETIEPQQASFVDVLSRALRLDDLHSLTLAPLDDVGVYGTVLATLGPRVREVQVYLPSDAQFSLSELVLHLPLCRKLEQLCVELDLSVLEVDILSSQVQALSDFFTNAQITSQQYPTLNELVFKLHLDMFQLDDTSNNMRPQDLTPELDKMLVDIVGQSYVKEIDCRWIEVYNPNGENAETWLRKLFPLLNEKKLLRLKYEGS